MWKYVAARDYLAGTFVWTGFDYGGEPGAPGRNSVDGRDMNTTRVDSMIIGYSAAVVGNDTGGFFYDDIVIDTMPCGPPRCSPLPVIATATPPQGALTGALQ